MHQYIYLIWHPGAHKMLQLVKKLFVYEAIHWYNKIKRLTYQPKKFLAYLKFGGTKLSF